MKPDFVQKRVVELLIERNISEYKASMELGHCKSYMQKITSGKANPSLNALNEFCNFVGITLSEFFYDPDEDQMPEYRKSIRDLVANTNGLEDQEIEILTNVAKGLQALKTNGKKR